MSSGWDTLPFLSHPDEIANFHFPHHAVALQRFRSTVLVLGKGGLHANESVRFIESHEQQIVWYEPSHVVVHVGHCDLHPMCRKWEKPLTKVFCDLEKIRDKLSDIVPNAEYAIGEMFPHVIARNPTIRDLDTKVRAYNRKIAQASKLNYHPQFRLSHRAADPQYFFSLFHVPNGFTY